MNCDLETRYSLRDVVAALVCSLSIRFERYGLAGSSLLKLKYESRISRSCVFCPDSRVPSHEGGNVESKVA